MKICPKCSMQIDDQSSFCVNCGTPVGSQSVGGMQQPIFDPTDHTGEFTVQDVLENKVVAMLPYLLGIMGIIIASLASKESNYVSFHVHQAIKIQVVIVLTQMCALILGWTIIVPIIAGIFWVILWIVRVISFVQVCKNKAKEPVIIKEFKFLK